MNHHDVEAHFIDLLEHTLDTERSAEVHAHLGQCGECRTRYAQYRALVQLEPQISSLLRGDEDHHGSENHRTAPADLTASILAQCTAPDAKKPKSERQGRLLALLGLSNIALVLIICVLVARSAVRPHELAALAVDDASVREQMYRTISLDLDAATGAPAPEGALRADILFSRDTGRNRQQSLARFVKVLSVERTGTSLHSVQLLIREKDVEQIQIARIIGDVEISLYREGSFGDDRRARPRVSAPQPSLPTPPDGVSPAVLYATDPSSGTELRYVRTGESWTPEPGVAVTGF